MNLRGIVPAGSVGFVTTVPVNGTACAAFQPIISWWPCVAFFIQGNLTDGIAALPVHCIVGTLYDAGCAALKQLRVLSSNQSCPAIPLLSSLGIKQSPLYVAAALRSTQIDNVVLSPGMFITRYLDSQYQQYSSDVYMRVIGTVSYHLGFSLFLQSKFTSPPELSSTFSHHSTQLLSKVASRTMPTVPSCRMYLKLDVFKFMGITNFAGQVGIRMPLTIINVRDFVVYTAVTNVVRHMSCRSHSVQNIVHAIAVQRNIDRSISAVFVVH